VECGACALICPRKVIDFREVEFGLEPELVGRCIGDVCNLCYEVCPGVVVPRSEIERKIMGRTPTGRRGSDLSEFSESLISDNLETRMCSRLQPQKEPRPASSSTDLKRFMREGGWS